MSRASRADIRRYLLGELDEESAMAIERLYVADPALVDEIAGVEHHLLDDYVAGRLAPAERAQFERRYPTTPARAERLATARTLAEVARTTGLTAHSSQARGWWPAPWWWMGAAALVALGAGVWLLQPRRPGPSPQQAAMPSPPPLPALPPFSPRRETPTTGASDPSAPPERWRPAGQPTTIALVLSPVLTPGEADAPRLAVPAGADLIELQLLGDREMTGLSAHIRSVDAGIVWSGRSGAPPRGGAPGLAAIVSVPAERLTPDDYIVTLAFDGPDEPPRAQYYFRVVQPR